MKLSELKPGQFWDDRGDLTVDMLLSMYLGPSGNRHSYAYRTGGYIAIATCHDREISRPLPDCTGWDWQPPEPAPKYRPFANAEEFKPHRDRWVRHKANGVVEKIHNYSDRGVTANRFATWEELFSIGVFDDDGSPCGVKL